MCETLHHIISCYLIYILANKEVLGQNLLIKTAVQVGGGYDEFSQHLVLWGVVKVKGGREQKYLLSHLYSQVR